MCSYLNSFIMAYAMMILVDMKNNKAVVIQQE